MSSSQHKEPPRDWPEAHQWLPALWAVSLAAVIIWPHWTSSPTLGDDLTRWTVRVALAFFAPALLVMIAGRPDPSGWWNRFARLAWTLGCATFLVHLGMAFHYYHHWSHADAIARTQRISGYGAGVYFSHLFTLLWLSDVLAWWLHPAWRAARPAWLSRLWYGYMIFIAFNGMVVFETGPIRWAGFTMVAAFLLCAALRRQAVTDRAGIAEGDPQPSACQVRGT